MGLKTEKTQKLKKERRYYTPFGKLKFLNIVNDIVLVLSLSVLSFFLLQVFYLTLKIGFDVNVLGNYNTYLQITQNVFKNFLNLRDFEWPDKVFFYYFVFIFSLIFIYFLYLIHSIKKADLLAKLSSLNLEGYRLKYRKNGLLFIVRRGEELDKKKFEDESLENIRQVFSKFFGDDEVVVERYKNRGFYIKKVKLNVAEFDVKNIKKGQIYFGRGLKNGDIYLKIPELTHFLIVGQSGAGKSVFQNLLINQFIYNLKNGVEELYLIDLKGGVEFLQYSKFKNVKVITDIPQLLNLSRFLIEKMDERYKRMIKKGWKNWKKEQIIIIIDEYASVQDQAGLLEKEEEKELKNNLRTLLAKARASGIKFFVSTQKATSDSIDTTLRENLQSKILMRTVSKDAQKVVIPKEQIEELGVEPARFGKGRFVLFTEKILDLVQSPFIEEDFYKKIEELRKDLVLQTDTRIQKKKDESCHEAEADNFEAFEDGEIGGTKKPEIKAEASDNQSPKTSENVGYLEEAIRKRKYLFNCVKKIEDEKLRKTLFKELRVIKKIQEEEGQTAAERLAKVEAAAEAEGACER
jgi:ABC-type oligopeptide transport system ATPase subunit